MEDPSQLVERVERLLAQVRPSLRADGGDIELLRVDAERGRVEVRLRGACTHCPASIYTMAFAVEARLKSEIPGIQEVVAM